MTNLETIKDKVEYILSTNKLARNSDRVLYVEYLKQYHNADKIDDLLDNDTPAMESLSRVRRKIQADGKFVADENTQMGRLHKEEEFIDFSRSGIKH